MQIPSERAEKSFALKFTLLLTAISIFFLGWVIHVDCECHCPPPCSAPVDLGYEKVYDSPNKGYIPRSSSATHEYRVDPSEELTEAIENSEVDPFDYDIEEPEI